MPIKKKNKKSVYFQVLEYIYVRADSYSFEGIIVSSLPNGLRNSVQKALADLVKDELIRKIDFTLTERREQVLLENLATGDVDNCYRITYKGYEVIESIRQRDLAEKVNLNVLRLTVVAAVISLFSVGVNLYAIPILREANAIQRDLLKATVESTTPKKTNAKN